MTFITLKVIGALVALRVRNEDEVMGLAKPSINTDYFLSSPSGHWRDFKRQPPAAFRSAGRPPGSRR
jgi:hypothetical protein